MLSLLRFRYFSDHLLEKAAHSVDHMFTLYFDYLQYKLFTVLDLSAGFGF